MISICSKAIKKWNYVVPKRFDKKIKYINNHLGIPFKVKNLHPSTDIANVMLIVDKNNKKDNVMVCSNLNNTVRLMIIDT